MTVFLWVAALAAPAPAPAPAALSAPAAAESEDGLWALVRKVDSGPAYRLYIRRFPAGIHRSQAEAAVFRREGSQPLASVSAPGAPWQMVDPPYDAHALAPKRRPGEFDPAYVDDPCTRGPSFEAPQDLAAYRDARFRNRIQNYRSYLADFPGGACAKHAQTVIDARAERARDLPQIAGLGPLPPHPLRKSVIGIDDYPSFAMRRGESGTVAAEWEVAADGSVESCHVVSSSGFRDLDQATCRLITLRMLYDPARDAAGRPVRAKDGTSVTWKLAG